MHDSPDVPETAATAASSAGAGEQWGWYLYGITRNAALPRVSPPGAGGADTTPDSLDGDDALESVTTGDLVAVVRRVPLAECTPEALQAQADNPAWLETMVRRHNAVVERLHRTQAILPAKFGSVYVRAEDVGDALADEHDTLLARWRWIDGCDEWGVRLYGDLAAIRQRANEEQESVRSLSGDLDSASPGRSYLLRRRLADERANALDRLLDDLFGRAYQRFASHAKAGQVSRRLSGSRIEQQQPSAELLRAAFLVPRDATSLFIEDVRQFSESEAGLRCEH